MQRLEPVLVQELVPELAIEALDAAARAPKLPGSAVRFGQFIRQPGSDLAHGSPRRSVNVVDISLRRMPWRLHPDSCAAPLLVDDRLEVGRQQS